MTAEESELARAEINSRQARAQLTATLVELQSRVNPRALAREAVEEIRSAANDIAAAGLQAARRNPGPLLTVGALLVAFVTRRHIVGALSGKPATAPQEAMAVPSPALPDPLPNSDHAHEGTDHD